MKIKCPVCSNGVAERIDHFFKSIGVKAKVEYGRLSWAGSIIATVGRHNARRPCFRDELKALRGVDSVHVTVVGPKWEYTIWPIMNHGEE